jgi:hypothetical protein
MARSLRIPGVIDIVRTDDPGEIEAFAADSRLDREFDGAGPLVNRIVTGRIRRNLHVEGLPLPPVAPREAPGRAAQQADLEAKLATPVSQVASADLDRLALHVLGRSPPDELGPLVQQILGRLFVPDYHASAQTWADAGLLDASVRSFNPLRWLVWWFSGGVDRARQNLTTAIGYDRTGLHTTGIAVHNMTRTIERMRDLATQSNADTMPPANEAIARCLSAPKSVLREATAPGATAAGGFRRGTLVMLRLEAARAHHARRDIAFMARSWSRCPARDWVVSLLTDVWGRACAMRRARASE